MLPAWVAAVREQEPAKMAEERAQVEEVVVVVSPGVGVGRLHGETQPEGR